MNKGTRRENAERSVLANYGKVVSVYKNNEYIDDELSKSIATVVSDSGTLILTDYLVGGLTDYAESSFKGETKKSETYIEAEAHGMELI